MIILDCEQGTDEWHQARLGIITASVASEMITGSTLKRSASWPTLRNKLISERLLGKPHESFISDWMQRGTELEPKAALLYELHHDVELVEVGFCYMDETKQAGFSPDRLMPDIERGLEIKCSSPNRLVGFHLGGKLPSEYKPQVYSSLYMSGYKEWDFMSYHPEMAPFYFRTSTQEKEYQNFAAAFGEMLTICTADINAAYEQLKSKVLEAA